MCDKMVTFKDISSRGGLVVERLLHKKCHSATVDRIMVYQSFRSGSTLSQFQLQDAGQLRLFLIHALDLELIIMNANI